MKINITTNLDQVRRELVELGKQVDFAAAQALTRTAKDVQAAMPAGLERQLDRPTPFTKSGTFVQAARRDSLVATVAFKDRQASYLQWQVEGGVRSPNRKALRLPAAIALDNFGNLPKGIIQQLLAVARREGKLGKRKSRRIKVSNKLELFYGDPADVGGHRFPPGIYKIVDRGAGRTQLVPLIVFPARSATYRKRLDLVDIAQPVVSANFGPHFEEALRNALRTAR